MKTLPLQLLLDVCTSEEKEAFNCVTDDNFDAVMNIIQDKLSNKSYIIKITRVLDDYSNEALQALEILNKSSHLKAMEKIVSLVRERVA